MSRPTRQTAGGQAYLDLQVTFVDPLVGSHGNPLTWLPTTRHWR